MVGFTSSSDVGRVYATIAPTPRDLLNKIHVLQQIKRNSEINSIKQCSDAQSKVITATEAALKRGNVQLERIIRECPFHFKYLEESDLSQIVNIANSILEIEKENCHSVVGYHGNESSFLSDVYGSIAHVLTISKEGEECPLPRLEADNFESDIQVLLKKK